MTAPITSKEIGLEHEKTDDKLLLPKRIIMWDVATRICHLGLVLSVSASLWYGYQTDPESSEFLYHMLAGLLALWFLAVRLVLACCGARTLACFSAWSTYFNKLSHRRSALAG